MEDGGDPTHLTGNTLHSDATTKFHHHYQGFQITLRDGKQITIGLTEVGAGDADTYLDAFKSTIHEIADAVTCTSKDERTDAKIAKLVTSLKNTMGDQGPTNPQFNSKLTLYREELLPQVVGNWDQLSDTSREAMSDMGTFFLQDASCLSTLPLRRTRCSKLMSRMSYPMGKTPYTFSAESGAARLVRTTAKAFTDHGCDKSGIAADWNTYLQQIDVENKLVTYRANRFNILFYSAAATFYHRKHI